MLAAIWKTLSADVYTIGFPVAACSSPSLSIISVPEAVQFPSTPGTPVRFTNSSMTSAGNPFGYVGKATFVSIPTISQCPTVVSLPSESSAHLPYAAVGTCVVSSAFIPSMFPSPILIRLGILSPLLYSHTCASVWVPTSPNLAASGCSPIPTLSRIIHITLFIYYHSFHIRYLFDTLRLIFQRFILMQHINSYKANYPIYIL